MRSMMNNSILSATYVGRSERQYGSAARSISCAASSDVIHPPGQRWLSLLLLYFIYLSNFLSYYSLYSLSSPTFINLLSSSFFLLPFPSFLSHFKSPNTTTIIKHSSTTTMIFFNNKIDYYYSVAWAFSQPCTGRPPTLEKQSTST